MENMWLYFHITPSFAWSILWYHNKNKNIWIISSMCTYIPRCIVIFFLKNQMLFWCVEKIASQFLILRSNNVRNILSIYIDIIKESSLLPLVTKILDFYFFFSWRNYIHSSF